MSSDQPVSRSFTFAYDPSKRLTQAIYNGSSGENFTVDQLTYDANSQIKTLRRFGAPGGGVLDNLSYIHQGMRLSQVSDAQTNTFGGFIPRGQGNYSYNSFGQLTSDQNEQIQQISYNSHLKLPTQVVLTDGRRIEYSYSGAGELIKTEYFSSANQPLERWEYIGDLVLRNGALFQVAVPDGRAVFASGSWNYELHYTDHLGNVRASINRQGQLISSSHFDPWGHRLQGFIPRGQGNSNYNALGQLVSDANEVIRLRGCAHWRSGLSRGTRPSDGKVPSDNLKKGIYKSKKSILYPNETQVEDGFEFLTNFSFSAVLPRNLLHVR